MTFTDLLAFRSIKKLKKYLKDNSISFSKRKYVIEFHYSFFGIEFDVSAYTTSKDKIDRIYLEPDFESYEESYEECTDKMIKVKDSLTEIFGRPTRDNMNHLNRNDIFVHYEKDDILCDIICSVNGEFIDDGYCSITCYYSSEKNALSFEKKPVLKLILYCAAVFIAAGFAWGILFFIFCGLLDNNDFSFTCFKYSMLGGFLGFGVAFPLILGLVVLIQGKLIPKIKAGILRKKLKLNETDDIYEGTLVDYEKNHDAILKVTDSGVVLHSLINKKRCSYELTSKKACEQLLFDGIKFKSDNGTFFFCFKSLEKEEALCNLLCEKVIDREKFNNLFDNLKKVTLDYNPYSIFDSENEGFLDKEIEKIANCILVKKNLSPKRLKKIVSETFLFENYTSKALADLYSDFM